MRIEIKSNVRGAIDQLRLDSDEYKLAVMRSLNRTADGLKTDASREIRSQYQIKAKDLSPAFSIKRATTFDLKSEVGASGRPLPIYDFAARWTRRMAGASVAIKKGTRKTLKGSFIARMPSGHAGVFARDGRSRLPIAEKFTISVPGMFGAKAIFDALKVVVNDRFEKAMEQNTKFLLRK